MPCTPYPPDERRGLIAPLLPDAEPGDWPPATGLREVMDRLPHLDQDGCLREMLPHDLLHKNTAYEHFAT